jgi:hypothetical protein
MLYNYVNDEDEDDYEYDYDYDYDYDLPKELIDRKKIDNHVLKIMKKEQCTINDKMTKACRSGMIRGALTGCITGGFVGGITGGTLFGIVNPLLIYLEED